MAENFNAYHKWLGIPPEEQPPNYYQLLGVRAFEDDDDVIANAADQRMAHVRTFQSGKNSELSQKILNQLAQARLCLLKPDKKTAYDTALRQHQAAKKLPPSRPAAAPPVARRSASGAVVPASSSAIGRASPPLAPASDHSVGDHSVSNHSVGDGPTATHATASAAASQHHSQAVVAAPVAVAEFDLDSIDHSAPSSPAASRITPRNRKPVKKKSNLGLIFGAVLLGLGIAGGVTFYVINKSGTTLARTDDDASKRSADAPVKPSESGSGSKPEKADKPAAEKSLTDLVKPTNPKSTPPPTPGVGPVTPVGPASVAKPENVPFIAAMKAVREAMVGRNTPAITAGLQSAKAVANDAAEKLEIARLERLSELQQNGLVMLRERLLALMPGDEFIVSKPRQQKVLVTEVNPDGVTFEVDSRPFTYSAEQLPPVLAEAIVLRDEPFRTPEHMANLAAILTVQPKGDRAMAKVLFEKAAAGGFDVASLQLDLPSGFPTSVVSAQPPVEPSKVVIADPIAKPVAPPATANVPTTSTPGETADSEKKLPVPSPEAQKTARALIDNLYREDLSKARTAQAKTELSKTLASQAAQSKDDTAAQYVLLSVARDLAIDGGEPAIICGYIDRLAQQFEVDALALKIEALGKAAKTVVAGTPASKEMAETLLALVAEAISAEDFDSASDAQKAATLAANKSRDAGVTRQVSAARKEIVELQKQFEIVKQARETLKDSPDDPAANGVAGRFACFVKRDWEEGVPLLAKSNQPLLQAAAKAEQAAPTDAKSLTELADLWWTAAEKEIGGTKLLIQKHAASFYEKALPQVSGLAEVKVKKRLDEVEKAVSASDAAADSILSPKNAAKIKKKTQGKEVRFEWKSSDSGPFATHFKMTAPKVWESSGTFGRRYSESDRNDIYVELKEDRGGKSSDSLTRLYSDHSERVRGGDSSRRTPGGWVQQNGQPIQ